MTGFDNGPPHGDYARYIDDLMKRAALAAPAVVSSTDDRASDVDALLRERTDAAASGTATAGAWTPTAPSVSRTRPPVPSSASGFAAPAAASPAATAASAIAAALMSGQVGRRAALPPATIVALVGIVVGVVLILFGVLWPPFNLAVIVGGIALISWAVRRLKAAAIPTGPTRST